MQRGQADPAAPPRLTHTTAGQDGAAHNQPALAGERLAADLTLLCAQPSTTRHAQELANSAALVARMCSGAGLETTVIATGGPPLVVGRRTGRSPFTLLLYHHYDLTPSGPWRAWSHEPFQLAERDEMFFARGVAHGKGPLAAHLLALRTLLKEEGELPCGVVVLVEGECLAGSTHLATTLARHPGLLRADACLASAGERDATGRPFIYRGSKGLLQVRLRASGPRQPLAPGMSSTVRNPAWRLAWVLNTIKGEDEEVRITGFYDNVNGPSRSENAMLRKVQLDEQSRYESWGVDQFLFGMAGAALVQAEVTLPTCNLTSFTSDLPGDLPGMPASAEARLDFQLVPNQLPDEVLLQLREHLIARSFEDVVVEALPGSYPPAHSDANHPFFQQLAHAGATVWGEPPTLLPPGPFTRPLHMLAAAGSACVAALGLSRHDNAIYSADERIRRDDLLDHARLLIELLRSCAD